MARLKYDQAPKDWMVDLAGKLGISVENIVIFYKNTTYDHDLKRTKRQRTEDFFTMYYEGVRNG